MAELQDIIEQYEISALQNEFYALNIYLEHIVLFDYPLAQNNPLKDIVSEMERDKVKILFGENLAVALLTDHPDLEWHLQDAGGVFIKGQYRYAKPIEFDPKTKTPTLYKWDYTTVFAYAPTLKKAMESLIYETREIINGVQETPLKHHKHNSKIKSWQT